MPATVDLTQLAFTRLPSKTLPSADSARLLSAIKQVEKRSFPPSEAFDFDSELRKSTTSLYCAHSSGSELFGYIVFVRSKRLTRIHKVAVVDDCRRQGVGRWMLQRALKELRRGGASNVDLWVDVERRPAQMLYTSCGFEQMETVEDYYAPGRSARRMQIDLDGIH